ncbi:MAG: hypothetical protein ACREPA_10875 [Candidatus Dormibacteraceae bacterium]
MRSRVRRGIRFPVAVVLALSVAIWVLPYGRIIDQAAAGVLSALTANPAQLIANTSLNAPTGLTAQPSGRDVILGWNAANGSGYSLQWRTNPNSTCPGAAYPVGGTTVGLTLTDVTERARPAGTWICYRAVTTYAGWSSQGGNPTVAAQVGFLANSVRTINGGTAGAIDQGDSIIVTFNQPATPPTVPGGYQNVCASTGQNAAANTIYLFTDGALPCSGVAGATLTGGRVIDTGGGDDSYPITYAWSNGSPATGYSTLTMTLGADVSGQPPNASGTWTFIPAPNTVTSATGGLAICTTAPACTPSSPSGF